MSNTKSWLKSFMFEEEDHTQQAPADNTVIVKTAIPVSTATTYIQVDSDKERKVIDNLLQLLDQANLPGPDFYEFYVALKEMQKSGIALDEAMLYRTVYTTLKITGLTKDKLVQSCNQYLAILNDHMKEFEHNHQQTVNSKVGSKVSEKEVIDKSVADKKAQIESLNQEIAAFATKKAQLEVEIRKETENIESTSKAFMSGFNKLTGELSVNAQKINGYIQ
jgi:hypothetical protein